MPRKALLANQRVEMLPHDFHDPYLTVSNVEWIVHVKSTNIPGLTCLLGTERNPPQKSPSNPQMLDQEWFVTKRS